VAVGAAPQAEMVASKTTTMRQETRVSRHIDALLFP
jgi:hypothetical protein